MFALAKTNSNDTALRFNSPADYLVMDIETGDAHESAIATATEAWRPGPSAKSVDDINAEADKAREEWRAPSNVKDPAKIEERRLATLEKIEHERTVAVAKIQERQAEAMARIRERSALLDSAPILCVGAKTQHASVEFNAMDNVSHDVGDVAVFSCGCEKAMLLELRSWLDMNTDCETVIVGQNIKGFDLPKLRNAYIRHRLALPAIFAPRLMGNEPPAVDTAQLFRSYSVEHRDDFCPNLDVVCAGLGIPKPKSLVSGADVPRMHREGRHHEILMYNAIDVAATARAYMLMTGLAEDLT